MGRLNNKRFEEFFTHGRTTMNIMRYLLAALFALSLTGPAVTAQAAVLPDQLQGNVAA